MPPTVSILPFVKRAPREELQLHANSNTEAQRSAGTCPHCGGLLLPGESATECSSAPRQVNPVARPPKRPSCVLVVGAGR